MTSTRARLLTLAVLVVPLAAHAVPFTLTFTNTTPAGSPAWSTGLVTLAPVITLGLTPQPSNPQYNTYAFGNSHCEITAGDSGNAALLATRLGLTLGTNAWVVNAIPSNNGTASVTIDVPVNSSISYITWVNDPSVFDDFIAMHPPGNTNNLSVPLFSGGVPVENVDFVLSGYDMNSTSATNGSGATCTPNECPTATTGCFVAPGNASYGATGALPSPPTVPVKNFTGVSGNAQVRLAWSNVLPHTGVLVVRRPNTAVTWTPTDGTSYTLNQQVAGGGNPTTVIYVENGTVAASAVTNSAGLTNGSRYFYKVFSFANGRVYSTGSVPTTNGIFAEPTNKVSPNPLWCYSLGLPTLQQPTTELGAHVYTGSNGGTLSSSNTQAGASDGWETWRPAQLNGAVQMRSTLVPLVGRTGNWLITGDQTGRGYLVNAATGAVAWTTAVLGDAIQGQPVTQLYAYANAAFQSANMSPQTRDLIFFATRNASATNNKVYAVSSRDGAIVWTYQPNNLDIINGGMAVDYVNNRLWVAARGNPSLRVLSTTTGVAQSTRNLGAIDFGVNLRFVGGVATEAVTVNTAGTAYGLSLSTMNIVWQSNLGIAPTAYAFPINTGFIASLTNVVRRYDVLPDAGVNQVWSANVAGGNGITLDYVSQTLYVGGTGTTLRQLNLATGATVKSLTMPTATTTTFGQPTLDTTANRLHVGTLDGRLCAFPVPFP